MLRLGRPRRLIGGFGMAVSINSGALPQCTVCYDELAQDLSAAPCGHVFHSIWSVPFIIYCTCCWQCSTGQETPVLIFSFVCANFQVPPAHEFEIRFGTRLPSTVYSSTSGTRTTVSCMSQLLLYYSTVCRLNSSTGQHRCCQKEMDISTIASYHSHFCISLNNETPKASDGKTTVEHRDTAVRCSTTFIEYRIHTLVDASSCSTSNDVTTSTTLKYTSVLQQYYHYYC